MSLFLTLIAVPECVAVDVEGAVEEEEAKPGLECVDWHDEQDPDNVALLRGILVVDQVLVNLKKPISVVIKTFWPTRSIIFMSQS